VHVLVRPRPGDFCYSASEIDVSIADVRAALAVGADGVVVGALVRDGDRLRLDVDALRRIVDAARGAPVTMHRAIDWLDDPVEAMASLVELGVSRVLTSGGAATVQRGLPTLARMVRAAAGRIEVMAGGGVDVESIPEIGRSGVDAVHLSAKRSVSVAEGVSLGSATTDGVTTWFMTDRAMIARAAALLAQSDAGL
jgi:copper homeostasis protein